jgi:repressor LexA
MPNDLTDRQSEILSFIEKFISENEYPPSLREIGENFAITPKAVHDHLRALQKKGAIKIIPEISRGIVVL